LGTVSISLLYGREIFKPGNRRASLKGAAMARTDKLRVVRSLPSKHEFKPSGVPSARLKKIGLTLDEYEAIRLADFEGFSHEDAAKLMNISRPTFSRVVEKARRKLSEFIVEGKKLVIEGGNVEIVEDKEEGSS
jgi:predicted DNA-binding protein (UPF0251 family)